ncbi:glucosylglycerol hydrolase [Rhodohalobacter mucosus]|uniref:Uncharacterized protein n=1 Tax=Rhodohalobacter mucosus TaxID=2079485 RepID=A0A316TX27_9BACT|nr:glucosylglycerol hydrolase [Rhodohalobacter mucosus]PWN07775.1 hypothetical protein DDZ15_01815 [Rhodohalobacter mucosus]
MISISTDSKETKTFAKQISSKLTYGSKKAAAEFVAEQMGAHVDKGGDSARFLFWHPDFKKADRAVLNIYVPTESFYFDKPEQHIDMTWHSVPLTMTDEFACAVVRGIPAGNRDVFGSFYDATIHFKDGSEATVRDPMAWSMPFGIYAPAELYDVEKVRSERQDTAHFKRIEKEAAERKDGRVGPPVNLLEVHTASATDDGTLQSLAARYRRIGAAIRNGSALTADQQNLAGFDAVELMPLEPVIQHPERHRFWSPVNTPEHDGDEMTVKLKKPNVINWGYDIVLFGSVALNPSILSTGRPHELLELIETLHNFPGKPIKVILDVVYGHSDNQGLNVLPESFFAGPNMYGQNIDFQNPLVRAMVLEMQRRKIDWGFDGVRVDGAQDFKYYDEQSGQMIHDDRFLEQMSDVEQHVAGVSYKPWMIFEDGRPWPRDDWELASTYREITEMQKHPFQWASMIFAYNTPYNYTYWVSKWWRLRELFRFGNKWITGYANHDTMRRGTQTDPSSINVNFQLGNSLKMVMDNAYNNPATTLVMSGFLPGVPMDFVQALGNTPWSFIRNTDTTYAVKVAAEEAHFTEWQITEVEFRNPRFFNKLKDMGFKSLGALRRFSKALLNLVKATDYRTDVIASSLNQFDPPFDVMGWDADKLNQFALAWTEDLHLYTNADNHRDQMDPDKAAFNLSARRFRLNNPWLREAFTADDMMDYQRPVDGTVIFYGYRKDPATGKELILAANMEGQARLVDIPSLGLPVMDWNGWEIALKTPTLKSKKITDPIKLSITQGILFQRG